MAECLKRFLEEDKAEKKDKLLLSLCIPNSGVENSIMGGGRTYSYIHVLHQYYISNGLF